jgi:hypothetical protein
MSVHSKTFLIRRDSSLVPVNQFIEGAIGYNAYLIDDLKVSSIGPGLTSVTVFYKEITNHLVSVSPPVGSTSSSDSFRGLLNLPAYTGIPANSVVFDNAAITGYRLQNNGWMIEASLSGLSSVPFHTYKISDIRDYQGKDNFTTFIGGYSNSSLGYMEEGHNPAGLLKGKVRIGITVSTNNVSADISNFFLNQNIRDGKVVCWDKDSYSNLFFLYIEASEPQVIASFPKEGSTHSSQAVPRSVYLQYNDPLLNTNTGLAIKVYSGYGQYSTLPASSLSVSEDILRVNISGYVGGEGSYSLYVPEGVTSKYGIASRSPYMLNLGIGNYTASGSTGAGGGGGTGAPTTSTYILNSSDPSLPNALTLDYANRVTGVVVGSKLYLSGVGLNEHITDVGIHFSQEDISIDSTQIADFTESTQDVVGAFATGMSGISVIYNDAGNTLTIALSGWLYTGITGHIGITSGNPHGTTAAMVGAPTTGNYSYLSGQWFSHASDTSLHFTEASINHDNILNIGTYGHDTIDTHIDDTSIHFSQGAISISSTQVSDFTEASQDVIGALVIGQSGITTVYNDATNTFRVGLSGWLFTGITGHIGDTSIHFTQAQISIPSTQISDFTEASQDVVGAFVAGQSGITVVYNDTANSLTFGLSGWLFTGITGHIGDTTIHFTQAQISISSTQISDFTEAVQDTVGSSSFLLFANGMSGTYSDAGNTLTLSGLIATATTLGVASYNSSDFSVSSAGSVTIANRLHVNSGLRDLASPETGRYTLRVRYNIEDFAPLTNAWSATTNAGGAGYQQDAQYTTALQGRDFVGAITADNGTSTGSTGASVMAQSQLALWMRDNNSFYYNVLIGNTGQSLLRFGLMNNTAVATGAPTNGAYFEYDSRSGITWMAMTASGGNYTRVTTLATGVTSTFNWYGIECVSTGYRFYDFSNSNYRLLATITTTLPSSSTSAGRAFIQAIGNGANYRGIYLDKFAYPIYYSGMPSGLLP